LAHPLTNELKARFNANAGEGKAIDTRRNDNRFTFSKKQSAGLNQRYSGDLIPVGGQQAFLQLRNP
jgi:hypothetical protein